MWTLQKWMSHYNFSRKFQDRQYNWSTYEQELYALVESLKHFRPYVEGKKITLYTDHRALIYLNKQEKLTGKQARWIGFINLFDYEIIDIVKVELIQLQMGRVANMQVKSIKYRKMRD